MKVVIFIGQHKTGSSSLQEFLSQNSLALMRAGILYPAVEAEGMSLLLGRALDGQDHKESLPINLREAHNALAFKMMEEATGRKVPSFHRGLPSTTEMFRTIEHQIMALQPDAVVLTSEVMGHFSNVSPMLIRRLTRFFEGADIRIIANLRRVDDHIAAWHGQLLRFGHKINALHKVGISPYREGIHFEYRSLLEGWRINAPEAEIILRPYKEVLRSGGSIQDFMAQSGLKFPQNLLAGRHANRGLHRGLYEISMRANHRFRPDVSKVLFNYLIRITPDLDLPDTRDIELFSGPIRQNIAAAFPPIHDYLGDVSGRSPFFEDISEIIKSPPYDGFEVAQEALSQIKERKDEIQDLRIRGFMEGLHLNDTA